MKSLKYILMISFLIFILSFPVFAEWSNQNVLLSGTWGNGNEQFGLESGDAMAYDVYPEIVDPIFSGKIFINDNANKRGLVYSEEGQFIEVVPIQKVIEGEFAVYKWTKYYASGQFAGYFSNSDFWTEDEGTYRKYDSSFNEIQTSPTRPLELGKVTKIKDGTQWCYEVEYPDSIYLYDGPKDMLSEKGITRITPNLIMQNFWEKVYAYKVVEEITVAEGEKKKYKIDKVAEWVKPKSSSTGAEPIVKPDGTILGHRRLTSYNIYGQAVVGPDGSIYTWMRSETNYKILKWKWADKNK